jgi:RNA polymerase sigma-70 factor (sigma-E family)
MSEENAAPERGAAFAQFVLAREQALQRTAWLLTGDWALAEDLVQTALARAWPRWERIRRDDPEIYVRRIMINTWSTWRRRRWRGERPSDPMPENAAPGDLAADTSVRLAVSDALAELTERQRAVLILRVFDDMTEAAVAQALGCAIGTVKSTTAQALARLRANGRLADLMEREKL